MKAYLTDKDELVIEAESTVEVMALRYWSDNYFKRKPKRSSLLLQFTVARPTQRALDGATVEWVCACGLSQSQHVGVACEHRPASKANH